MCKYVVCLAVIQQNSFRKLCERNVAPGVMRVRKEWSVSRAVCLVTVDALWLAVVVA